MALAFVKESANAGGSGTGTPAAISLSPTAGNTVVVFVALNSVAVRTFTVTDNIDGATGWAEANWFNPNRGVGIWVKANVPSGITGITVSNSGSGTFNAVAAEFSGFGTSVAVDAFDELEDGAGADNHSCSSAGVSSANEVVAICSCTLTASATECNAGTDYTETPAGYTNGTLLRQWRIFPSGCTDEVGAWTSTGTDRIGLSTIALLSGAGAGGGGGGFRSRLAGGFILN